jgi:3-oxoacyl-[acyl-carrier protein] reductase
MDLGLSGRVVLVTGSSRGIGRATASLFAQEGARVAITYHSEPGRAEAAAAAIRAAGGEALVTSLDLASEQSIRDAVGTVLERWGRVDVLVNNAVEWGTRIPGQIPAFETIPAQEWRGLLHANLDGHYLATQAVVTSMRERGWGRIVNVSSGIAMDGMVGAGPYAAAKAALHGLTRTLAKELGPAGILVNVVMPGFTLTERNEERMPAQAREQAALASPIRRLLRPEEVAPTIVFLCSATNTAVTGEIVRASGGIT